MSSLSNTARELTFSPPLEQPEPFVRRARRLLFQRKYHEATVVCQEGLVVEPAELELYLLLGMALSALGRWQEVAGAMDKAAARFPRSALIPLLCGEALYHQRQYAASREQLLRAEDLDPQNDRVQDLLVQVEMALEDPSARWPDDVPRTRVYPAMVDNKTRKPPPPTAAEKRPTERVINALGAGPTFVDTPTLRDAFAQDVPTTLYAHQRAASERVVAESNAARAQVSGLADGLALTEPATAATAAKGPPSGPTPVPVVPNTATCDRQPKAVAGTLDIASASVRAVVSVQAEEPMDPMSLVESGDKTDELDIFARFDRQRAGTVAEGLSPAPDDADGAVAGRRGRGLPLADPLSRTGIVSASVSPPPRRRTRLLTIVLGGRRNYSWRYLASVSVGLIGFAVAMGFLVRLYTEEGNMRRGAQARLKLANRDDYQAAARLLAEVSTRRPADVAVRHARRRVEAALHVEFGEGEGASLSAQATLDVKGATADPDAAAVQIYAQLAAGELMTAADTLRVAREAFPASGALRYLQGYVYLLSNEPGSAVEAARQAVSGASDNARFVLLLARALAAQGETAMALERLDQALKVNRQHVGSLLARAHLLIETGRDAEGAGKILDDIVLGAERKLAAANELGWAYLLRGKLALMRGKVAPALIDLSQAQTRRPAHDPLFAETLAVLYIKAGRLGEAEQAIAQAQATMPSRTLRPLTQAYVHWARGEAVLARAALTHVPEALRPVALTAQIWRDLGDLAAAEQALIAGGADPRGDHGRGLVQASVWAAAGRLDEALRLLDELESRHGGAPQIVFARADSFFRAGQSDAARDVIRRLLAQDRDHAAAKVLLADIAQADGNTTGAMALLDQVVQQNPWHVAAALKAARLALARYDLARARSVCEKVLALSPRADDVRLLLVQILTEQHYFDDAEEALGRLQLVTPAALALARGRLDLAQGRAAQAATHLAQVTAAAGDDLEAWHLLVRAYLEDSEPALAQAAQLADRFTARFPQYPEAMILRGRIGLYAGKPEEAIPALRAALSALDGEPRVSMRDRTSARVLLGRAYRDAGRLREADQYYRRAIADCPLCPEPYYYRGILLDEMGRTAEAVSSLRRALKHAPRLRDTYLELSRLYQSRRSARQAIEMYQKYLDLRPPVELAEEARRAIRTLQSLV